MGSAMVKEEARPEGDDVVAVVPDLPISIISDILARLPVDDLARCKAVGKSWYELSKHPHFTHLHYFTTTTTTTTTSVLLWKDGSYASGGTWLDMTGGLDLIRNTNNKNGKWKSITLPPEANVRGGVEASCNGLLCLNNGFVYEEGPNLVYNPLTREAIPLPQLNFHPNFEKRHWYKSALGFDPINNKYKLVVSYKRYCHPDYTWRMTAAILTLGETSWRTLQFPHDLQTAILHREPLFFNGAFHWVIGECLHWEDKTRLDGILLLDFTTENFQIINFSPSVEIPYWQLEQVQFENSLAFARLNDDNHPSFEIWQIQGANTDGTCLYKHRTFNVQIQGRPLINMKGFRLLGAFHNGVFLFKAYQTSKRGEPLRNHLVIYDTRKDQGSVIEISGVPKYFSARIFSPSFISHTL